VQLEWDCDSLANWWLRFFLPTFFFGSAVTAIHSIHLVKSLQMGKKPFINRKEAKHYHVVHRSQKDPLINDESASQRVLQEVVPPNLLKVS
jgi:hypothetical protein